MPQRSTPPEVTTPLPDEVGRLAVQLRLSTTRLARRLRAESDANLTPSLHSALAMIHAHGPLTMGTLAELEGVAPPTVTKIVARLEHDHLVERISDPDDGRVRRVATSPSGEELLARSRERKNAWLAGRLGGLDREDLLVLHRAGEIVDELLQVDRAPDAAVPESTGRP